MRKTVITVILVLISLPFYAQGYKGEINLDVKSLTEKNDSLLIHLDIEVLNEVVSSCSSMRITPELTDGNKSLILPHVLIRGNNKRQMDTRWKSLKGKKAVYDEPYSIVEVKGEGQKTVNYLVEVPYDMWMDNAVLLVHQELIGCRNEHRLFTASLNKKVDMQPRLPYEPKPLVALSEPAPEQKVKKKQGQAFLDFQVGRSVILPDFRRNPEELRKIKEAFREIQSNPDAVITGLFVEGYASPDGLYATNERLSRERSYSLKEYMKANFNLPDHMFRVTSIPEDWEGLRLLVEESNIDRKQEVLDIIDRSETNLDAKELRLMKIAGGAIYRQMSREMFPQLRRVEYQIDYSVKDYNVEEIKSLIGKKDELLGHREFYIAAQSYGETSKEYKEILMERILKFYPNDPVALNNAAAVMIKDGEYVTARRFLEKLENVPAVMNNLGVIYLQEGKLQKAEELFKLASGMGLKEAQHNLHETQLKREDNVKMERYKKR